MTQHFTKMWNYDLLLQLILTLPYFSENQNRSVLDKNISAKKIECIKCINENVTHRLIRICYHTINVHCRVFCSKFMFATAAGTPPYSKPLPILRIYSWLSGRLFYYDPLFYENLENVYPLLIRFPKIRHKRVSF